MKQKTREQLSSRNTVFFFGGKKHKQQSIIQLTISNFSIVSLDLNYFIVVPKNESKQITKMYVYGKLREVFSVAILLIEPLDTGKR